VPVSVWALNWLVARLSLPAAANHVAVQLLLQYPYILLSLFLSYLAFTFLSRVSLVNRLFTWTTLVHYFRRYHEPDTAIDDLTPERRP